MSGFFQSLVTDAANGFFGNDYLRDYTHAAKTFRANAYHDAPRLKFLFHVYFEINPAVYSVGLSTKRKYPYEIKIAKITTDIVTLDTKNPLL